MRSGSDEGRILAIDYGRRRMGLAVSDRYRTIASPLDMYQCVERERDLASIGRLVVEEGITRIVLGMPVHTTGREGEMAAEAREFGERLGAATGVPVVYRDERYTSQDADEILRESGVPSRARKGLRDSLSAQLLLGRYLEAGCPMGEARMGPIEDGGGSR